MQRPTWFLDETTSLGRENTDPEHVAHYDAKEDAGAASEIAALRKVFPAGSSDVVDLGAGTGQFALLAAEQWENVTAVDPSPVMLRVLREKAEAAGSSLHIVEAGYLTYERPSESVDLVYSRYALHHLPDFWKAIALARIRAMLRPGGILRLWDVVYHFPLESAIERIEHWCSTGYADEEGGWTRADLEEHVRDEHSTFTWLLEPMLTEAGFAIEEAGYGDDGIFAKYLLRAV
ncbi:class I SAM-dependent methyltransferase [Microbacterium limosum]|uniref:Class I SAM-dependent methyltransferase n=1 Tax=Microbacterium limosum TaxID=3079935 RepID=A0AAU0MFW6_9MICO|nr:class I SAM-dependent methyltransferase [Microbacterium sp. Y20]WOQ69455.1 class I SAM-dependent methyltransferase [Microbacterium sp. Y20]